ncbi:MAG: MaoC family dehydratase N-terminal domain-containing protein, partial [Rhodospirillales bacterium]|nr:MaoC family dehydratase N-terminal domain-containing protein [Rhodospirillales bacterium]
GLAHPGEESDMPTPAASCGFEQLAVGQEAAFETELTDRDIDAFAALSGDANPLHVEPAFARDRGFPDRVAHGAHLVALASRLVGMHLPGRDALLLAVQASFTAPVHPGTRLTVTGTVDQLSDGVRSAILKLRVTETGTGRLLARGKLTVGFTDRGRAGTPGYG